MISKTESTKQKHPGAGRFAGRFHVPEHTAETERLVDHWDGATPGFWLKLKGAAEVP
jgi:hypothetical protein